ncbi:MAG: MBL fold metallo-hydrolase [Oscillospiraceae bacterium]|jgi:7,8-dihydropterin-6-yl-methyl-4-(beta-D-ribofuranosyl)aminobenzene 5'-phosphate synthase|nr:MBL fold metallo-hydrolase [Oscillospiraceae bacterium]
MRITTLAENTTVDSRLHSQHGLSLYIETERHKILFDTGANDLFLRNAEALGIDLSKVDTVIISHGHSDHGGGLAAFLQINTDAKVYIQASAFEPHFVKVLGLKIGVGLQADLAQSGQIVWVGEELQIDEELYLFSTVAGKALLPTAGGKLYKAAAGKTQIDDFTHEQYLVIAEAGKKTLITGCSHKGIYNVLQSAEERCGKMDSVVGGFHLFKLPTHQDALIAELAEKLAESKASFYTCHCTGQKAYEKMKRVMGDGLKSIGTGSVFSL